MWKACFEVRQRPRQRLWSANTAMHLSCRRNVLFFAEKTLRPGDGERWANEWTCERLLLRQQSPVDW